MQTTPQPTKRDTRFKRKTGDKDHASGTIIHWDVRDPEDAYGTIGITCHGCRQERFVPKASIKNSSWHGLCSDCISAGKLPKKLTGKEKLDSGAVVDWDRADPNNPRRRMVACPNFSRCSNETFKRIDAGNKNAQPFYCRPCFIEDRRSRMAAAWGARSRNNGDENIQTKNRARAGRARRTGEATWRLFETCIRSWASDDIPPLGEFASSLPRYAPKAAPSNPIERRQCLERARDAMKKELAKLKTEGFCPETNWPKLFQQVRAGQYES